MLILALRRCFLFVVLIYSLFLFLPGSIPEPALLDYDGMELLQMEQMLIFLSQETAIHKLRPVTYPLLIYAGISILSLHLGGHAPPFAGGNVKA